MKTLSLSCFLTLSILLSCSNSNSTEEHPLSYEKKEVLTKGKKLFMVHCSECHHKSMTMTMTAPPLERAVKNRTQSWIKQYIRKGGERSVLEGDSIAIELEKEGWALMPPFDYLSEEEINNVVSYINYVCQK